MLIHGCVCMNPFIYIFKSVFSKWLTVCSKAPLCVVLLFRRYLCIIFHNLPSPEPTDHVETVTNKKAKEEKKVFL